MSDNDAVLLQNIMILQCATCGVRIVARVEKGEADQLFTALPRLACLCGPINGMFQGQIVGKKIVVEFTNIPGHRGSLGGMKELNG